MSLFYVLLLGFAVSLDSFVAGVAYGLKNIRIGSNSLAIVGLITAASAGIAMICAKVLEQFIDLRIAVLTGSVLLICLGGFSLFQEYLLKSVTDIPDGEDVAVRQVTFSLGRLVINIMVKPESADMDGSNSISPLEAFFLGLALGIDNMVATFAASLMRLLPLYTPLMMGVTQMAFISAGSLASCHLVSEGWKRKVPFLPGIILILIGLLRLS